MNFMLFNKNEYSISTMYRLKSMIVHVGSGIQQGHYFSIIHKNNKWYKIDDETVSVSNIHYILKHIKQIGVDVVREYMGNPDEDNQMNSSTCAYLLVYERLE